MDPQQFIQIKQKISASSILSEKEKQEWMFLVSRMNAEQLDELDKLLSIKLPDQSTPPPTKVQLPPRPKPTVIPKPRPPALEQGRPKPAKPVRQYIPIVPPPPRPRTPSPQPMPEPAPKPLPKPKITPSLTLPTRGRETKKEFLPLDRVPKKSVDFLGGPGGGEKEGGQEPPEPHPTGKDAALERLSTVSVEDIKKAKSIYPVLNELADRIRAASEKYNLTISDISGTFEKSPLYKSYLNTGLKKIAGEVSDELSQDEFEAVADFRASLGHILK